MEISDEKIRKAFENKRNNDLLGFTTLKLREMNKNIIEEIQLPNETSYKIIESLQGYKYVDEISDLRNGSYLRWIKMNNVQSIPKLNAGALYCEANITDNGISLLCKSVYNNRLFQLNLDENIIFQKLTNEELILLTTLDYISK